MPGANPELIELGKLREKFARKCDVILDIHPLISSFDICGTTSSKVLEEALD